jgi:hypothetical protein
MSRTRKVVSHGALALAALLALAPSDVARAGDVQRAIADLENDLVADDPAVRAKAADELSGRFPDGAVAVPMLVDLLDDESPEIAAAAAKAIDAMTLASVAPLAAYCDDDARLSRKSRLGETLEMTLAHDSPCTLDAIDLEELAAGTSPPDVAAAAAILPEDSAVRLPRPSLPMLLVLYRRAPADQRVLPAAALAQKGMAAPAMRRHPPAPGAARTAAAAAAMPFLRSDSDLRAWIGARLLLRIRADDEAVVAELAKTLTTVKQPLKGRNGEEIRVARRAAARALRELGPAAVAAAPALLDAAGKRELSGASAEDCVLALLAMGREADVVELLDSKPPTSLDIALALGAEKRATSKVVPVIVAGITEFGVYGHTIRAIDALGPDAAPALPALRKVAHDSRFPNQRLAAADAILAIAPGDVDALRVVDDVAKRFPEERVVPPIGVLADRAQPSPELVARLSAALDTAAAPAGDFYEIKVVEGLARCGALAKDTVPQILNVLANEEKAAGDPRTLTRAADRRRRIVVSLGRMGPDAAAAIPALTALRDKGDETIRVPAAQALRRIRAKK